MAGVSLAAVATKPRLTELKEFSIPDVPPDAGLLRVMATGICGSDWPMYLTERPGPRILGHEMVGVVEKLGDTARGNVGVSRRATLSPLKSICPAAIARAAGPENIAPARGRIGGCLARSATAPRPSASRPRCGAAIASTSICTPTRFSIVCRGTCRRVKPHQSKTSLTARALPCGRLPG